ncbi:MAG: Mrp/NBP35 family ATP-binding protein [Oscillospiraceae bacterium]|jgi:Mrp family chromosome partitioning ATPase|nr:Mrp/NBP35 family ATP-binding protein [Oscillospiraceae bacterium]
MSEPQCSHDCESCSANCASREGGAPQSFLEKPNKLSSIKKVIGVVSGKGGVGKSLVTSLMASTMTRKGYTAAILDADITGPSIPKIFGVTGPASGNEMGILPVTSKGGVDIMSVNLLLENDADPVVVRGPIIAGTVKQFWTDVIWTDVDFMFVDMPPGTGDVPLTVFQSIPVDGIIVVTSPQDLVSMIVAKAVKMAEMMNVPIIGLVENYSYFKCPDCGKEYPVFGKSHIDEIASQHHLPVLAKLPIDPNAARACDEGRIEEYKTDVMDSVCDKVVDFCSK